MVYKRYIKKNGKVCGPYYYESYRDKDGKVVSKYLKDYKPKLNLNKSLIVIVLLIGIAFLGVFFLKLPSGNVILNIGEDLQADYSIGDKINGTISLEIGTGEILDKDAILNLSLIKDGTVLDNKEVSAENFLNMISPAVENQSFCENITTGGEQVCENITTFDVVENCSSSDVFNETINMTETIQSCENVSVPSVVENCTTAPESVVENCSEILEYYYNQTGVYSRNISDFMDYLFNSAGSYNLVFESSSLGLMQEKTLSVSEGERIFGIQSIPGEIDSCQKLDTSGNYVLNISLNGTTGPQNVSTRCININVSDVVFDCNGFYISRPSGVNGPAVYAVNATNVTVKNCNLTMSNTGAGGLGVQFINVSNSFIDNTLVLATAYGFSIRDSSNVNITNSNINGSRFYGILFNNTLNSFITNVNASYINMTGIGIFNSSYNTINNCNTSNVLDTWITSVGVYLYNSSYNNIINSFADSRYVAGILIRNSSYNKIDNCSAFGNVYDGIRIDSSLSSFNNITNCSFGSNFYDINLSSGANSTYFAYNNIGNYSFDQAFYTTIENNYGMITFNNYTNGTGNNFSDDIMILNNSAIVNSSACSGGLNVSANISLYNMHSSINYVNRTILRDGITCNETTVPACYNLSSFKSGSVYNFSFKVDSWSNYSFYQGDYAAPPVVNLSYPANNSNFTGTSYNVSFIFNITSNIQIVNCSAVVDGGYHINSSGINSTGNLIVVNVSNGSHSGYVNCNDIADGSGNSTNVSFFVNGTCVPVGCNGGCGSIDNGCGVTIDCGACGGGSSGGGSSGGGSSTVNKTKNVTSTNETAIGTKSKNNSGSEIPKTNPLKKINYFDFGKSCNPEWSCGVWSDCNAVYSINNIIEKEILLKGEKSRICFDISNCMFDFIERQDCEERIPIIIKKGTGCFEGYIEVYNTDNTLISIMNLKNSSVKSLDIRFILDNTFYCPYCYNGVKDADETGVDCGGSCRKCPIFEQISLASRVYLSWELISIIVFIALVLVVFIFFINRIRHFIFVRKLKD